MNQTLRVPKMLFVLLFASVLQSQSARAADSPSGPDKEMMQPVTALVGYMEHVAGATLPPVFADHGLVIVENFAPYVFQGNRAAARWDAGFRNHAEHLTDLHCEFGKAFDFGRSGDRVYFVLPTTWRGVYMGSRRFEEHGAWSFALEKSSGQWRIVAYGWAATDETDSPLQGH